MLFPSIRYCADPHEVAEGAEALMIATEWEVFKTLDWQRVERSMLRPLILDGRNLLNGKDMAALGFEYQGVGTPIGETSAHAVPHQGNEVRK